MGGYSAGAPPLPIPNREVKPGRADGTAPQCGRVGRRPLFEERDALRRKSWGVPPPVFVCLCVRLCVLSRGPASPFRTELQFRVLRKGRGGLRRSRNRQNEVRCSCTWWCSGMVACEEGGKERGRQRSCRIEDPLGQNGCSSLMVLVGKAVIGGIVVGANVGEMT